ncbi:hypothetical protein D3C81_929560 [compost metagenome]
MGIRISYPGHSIQRCYNPSGMADKRSEVVRPGTHDLCRRNAVTVYAVYRLRKA